MKGLRKTAKSDYHHSSKFEFLDKKNGNNTLKINYLCLAATNIQQQYTYHIS